ncbi:uncharacterized protein PG986_013932 [Apiospora aurea]|uniref:Uncharacterized protein n=1 Tax=Apiospora aurea TaxID=335848 RepID=A0ABR1PX17_9PEZI
MNPATPACPEDSIRLIVFSEPPSRSLGKPETTTNLTGNPSLLPSPILGVLATLFAGVSIAQAIVFARKGYRKGNQRAIGEWALKAKSKLIWSEMNWHHATQTPIFLFDSLISWEQSEDEVYYETPFQFTATWPAFFSVTGLIALEPPTERDGLRSVSTEYLPDDLVAAPAYAPGGAIVVATAILGVRSQSFGKDLGNIDIVGPHDLARGV